MLNSIEIALTAVVVLGIFVISSQIGQLLRAVKRVEARLAISKPLKLEEDILVDSEGVSDELEDAAVHPSVRTAIVVKELSGLHGAVLHDKIKEIKWREKSSRD